MNILIASDIFFAESPGGSSRMVWEIGRGLAKRGHNVSVLAGGKAGLPQDENTGGLRVVRYVRSRWNPWKDRAAVARAAEKLPGKVDVVMMLHPFTGEAVVRLPKYAKTPSLYFFNSSWSEEYLIRRRFRGLAAPWHRWVAAAMNRVERRAVLGATRAVTISKFITELLLSLHPVDGKRIAQIDLGADQERFKPEAGTTAARRGLGWKEESSVVLSVRNLEPRMGLENLIEAAAALKPTQPDLELKIVGDGSLKKFLSNEICKRGAENYITLIGEVSDDALAACYRAADLFVLPTKALEGFGLVTVEALMSGCPAIGTPIGATPEILAPLDPSLLTNDATASGLRDAIARFLARRREWPALRERCARYARERYTWDRTTAEVERIAQAAVEEAR